MQLVSLGVATAGAETQSKSAASESSSDGAGGVTGGFVSVKTFGDLSVSMGSTFSFTIPADTFKHSDAKMSVAVEAKLENGGALPPWLTFDSGKKRFTGTPPQGQASLTVVMVARDHSGGEAFTKIQLNFNQSK
jgi:hypothetical protein